MDAKIEFYAKKHVQRLILSSVGLKIAENISKKEPSIKRANYIEWPLYGFLPAKPVVVFLARATNNKQQLNGLRAHISEILGAVGVHISSGGSAHFVIGFAGKQHARDQYPSTSEHVGMHPNTSECVRTRPKTSENVQKRVKTSENV